MKESGIKPIKYKFPYTFEIGNEVFDGGWLFSMHDIPWYIYWSNDISIIPIKNGLKTLY